MITMPRQDKIDFLEKKGRGGKYKVTVFRSIAHPFIAMLDLMKPSLNHGFFSLSLVCFSSVFIQFQGLIGH